MSDKVTGRRRIIEAITLRSCSMEFRRRCSRSHLIIGRQSTGLLNIPPASCPGSICAFFYMPCPRSRGRRHMAGGSNPPGMGPLITPLTKNERVPPPGCGPPPDSIRYVPFVADQSSAHSERAPPCPTQISKCFPMRRIRQRTRPKRRRTYAVCRRRSSISPNQRLARYTGSAMPRLLQEIARPHRDFHQGRTPSRVAPAARRRID